MEELPQLALPLVCGLAAFWLTRRAYKHELKAARNRTELLRRFLSLRLAEVEEKKAEGGNGE